MNINRTKIIFLKIFDYENNPNYDRYCSLDGDFLPENILHKSHKKYNNIFTNVVHTENKVIAT